MLIKMVNTGLILFAVFMGMKQGYVMFSGKQEIMDMFSK